MRNTLLSRPAGPGGSRARSPSPAPPTIRIIEATEPNTSSPAIDPTWSAPSPLAPRERVGSETRKRLVPKKSKLSLLGVGSSKDKSKDLSDVVRRVGGSTKGGFDIYVDQFNDETLPESDEIVMIDRKKSRVGLDGMRWGDSEVTNIPSVPKESRATLNVAKADQNKWWSIGRGRKDSKEKGGKENKASKEPPRTKSPEPEQSRARFNSLDSGILLASAPALAPVAPVLRPSLVSPSSAPVPTGMLNGLLAPTTVPLPDDDENAQSSKAVKYMRSVRSLARIGSWAQLRSNPALDEPKPSLAVEVKPKAKAAKKKKKEKKEKVQPATVRSSGSSFEAGALTASPEAAPPHSQFDNSLSKKRSFLGLVGMGLPSTMRLPTVRGGSNASSIGPAAKLDTNRLSVESRDRPASTVSSSSSTRPLSESSSLRPMSVTSSLRPLSTSSGVSRISTTSRLSSSSSTGSSVRWDEEGLETVKERRKKEREFISREDSAKPRASKEGRESRRGSDGRRRTSLAAVFPDVVTVSPVREHPVLTLEEATTDGHSGPEDVVPGSNGTPARRARPRPKSEQLLGKSRPQGIYEDTGAALPMLEAATDELALLIGHLDLEATPGATPGQSPWQPSPFSQERHENAIRMLNAHSPTKPSGGMDTLVDYSPLTLRKKSKGLRASAASATSLRPYAQMRSNIMPSSPPPQTYQAAPPGPYQFIGQQIAPWPTLNNIVSPKKLRVKKAGASPQKKATVLSTTPPTSAFTLSHKRTLSPAPAADPSPVFHALRAPPKAKSISRLGPSSPEVEDGVFNHTPISMTFGPRSPAESINDASPTPVFRKTHARKQSSLVPIDLQSSDPVLPLVTETKRVLGMRGTMGGSSTSHFEAANFDNEDPDSDIPDELAVLLQTQSEDESFEDTPPPCAALPDVPIPVFCLIDEQDHLGEVDESSASSNEDDTKKSFDFTGELKKLNESGAADRRSFVEQVENAFRTPARVDFQYALNDGFLTTDAPPVPALPSMATIKKSDYSTSSSKATCMETFSVSQLVEVPQPTLLMGADVDDSMDMQLSESYPGQVNTSMASRPSDGHLNRSFRFGGRPTPVKEDERPMTLGDIIPPPAQVLSMSSCSIMDDTEDSGFVMHPIIGQDDDVLPARPRPRMDSDVSSRRRSGRYRHSRQSSGMSFAGFDSFAEVRRGFEFNDDSRPAFYPPPAAAARHARQESVFSVASVSSFGSVINPGSVDPFDYGVSRMSQRPVSMSDDMSDMSMAVDDTFSFLKRDPHQRKRVASDASSFYFQAPATSQMSSYTRGHRRDPSNMSIASQGPPISMHNRSFSFAHRRNDSSVSVSSVAQSYAMYGANGGRAAYARHRQDPSMDSVMSDYSAMRGNRGGLSGDKMLESAMDYGAPLTAISASPESIASARLGNRSSYDSICEDRRSSMDDSDSLFERTGNGRSSSVSSGSVFGYDDLHPPQGNLLPPGQFRPLSVLSFDQSIHSAPKEDDTMISMLGGGHVRRLSVGSVVGQSPCVRVEKRKHSMFRGPVPQGYVESTESPLKSRIIEKASIASTSSFGASFGAERMIKAKHGLLQRQSLEAHCLSGEGEDLSTSIRAAPVFSRPGPASRSRSSTCTSYTTSSSGADTPPLSGEDGSSVSEGSVSSIDLSALNMVLANSTHPMSSHARAQARTRARGQGHNRRRMSQAHARASRSSVYETIEEELSSASQPPSPLRGSPVKKSKNNAGDAVFALEQEVSSINIWDDEFGIESLRRYYRLKDEANFTVGESQRTWMDTPFSLFALQSFEPPSHPAGMQAMLDASVQNFGPLPAELRRSRVRTLSRPSPYPVRTIKTSLTSDQTRPIDNSRSFAAVHAPLRDKYVASNVSGVFSRPVQEKGKPSPMVVKKEQETSFRLAPAPTRPRVASTVRRSALGWTKRSNGPTGKENSKKENTNKENVVGQGTVMTPGETLRLSRPRPRGRPTPASARPGRV